VDSKYELENWKGILQTIMRHIHRHVIQHPTRTCSAKEVNWMMNNCTFVQINTQKTEKFSSPATKKHLTRCEMIISLQNICLAAKNAQLSALMTTTCAQRRARTKSRLRQNICRT